MEFKKAWRYRCYLSARGEDVIDAWHSGISKKGRIKLERTLEQLAVQPKSNWGRLNASPLGNSIYVIHFSDENGAAHRLAGHFHGDSIVFVLTQPIRETNGKYHPSDYVELAESHKNNCDADLNARSTDCFYLDVHREEDNERAGPILFQHAVTRNRPA